MEVSTMNMGFAWRASFEEAWERGIERQTTRRGRLVGATRASASVFRALLRRPAGGTVVVLVPLATATPNEIVIDDQLRAAG
jgi:hypothetical protein